MEHYIAIDVEDKRSLKPFSSKQQDHDGLSAHAARPQRSTQASAQQSSFLHYARERQAISPIQKRYARQNAQWKF